MKIVSALFGLFLGALLGLGSALAAAGIIGPGASLRGNVDVKDWVSDWLVRRQSLDPRPHRPAWAAGTDQGRSGLFYPRDG